MRQILESVLEAGVALGLLVLGLDVIKRVRVWSEKQTARGPRRWAAAYRDFLDVAPALTAAGLLIAWSLIIGALFWGHPLTMPILYVGLCAAAVIGFVAELEFWSPTEWKPGDQPSGEKSPE